jgi:hypothetical protein
MLTDKPGVRAQNFMFLILWWKKIRRSGLLILRCCWKVSAIADNQGHPISLRKPFEYIIQKN